MSELVQHSRFDEIDVLQRLRLYSKEETSRILMSLTTFESKINRVFKEPQDFMEYINYLKTLSKQINERREETKIFQCKSDVEYIIHQRIKKLYQVSLQTFPKNFSQYLLYLKFCKNKKDIDAASTIIQDMILNCSDNMEAWKVAISWYQDDQKDPSAALAVINRGIQIQNGNQFLWNEALKLQLTFVDKLKKEEERHRLCDKIKSDIDLMCQYIKDHNFLIEILHMLTAYRCSLPIQKYVIQILEKEHFDQDIVWHTLAQREKQGSSLDSYLILCSKKYLQGLEKVSDSCKPKLWSRYLDTLLSSIVTNEDLTPSKKLKNTFRAGLIKKAFRQASEENCLSEQYYMKWLDLAMDSEIPDILAKVSFDTPQPVHMWKSRFKDAVFNQIQDSESIDKIFYEGIKQLQSKSLPLWLEYIKYYKFHNNKNKVKSIYQDGFKQSPEISQILKPQYIQWLCFIEGIENARAQYKILVNQLPHCLQLHKTMYQMESMELKWNFIEWGQVHELACKQFGNNDIDVWIDYGVFYSEFNKTKDVHQNLQNIYNRAVSTLKANLVLSFKTRFRDRLF